jgi:hypothetical protein
LIAGWSLSLIELLTCIVESPIARSVDVIDEMSIICVRIGERKRSLTISKR